jgi:hypothetical protein
MEKALSFEGRGKEADLEIRDRMPPYPVVWKEKEPSR